MFNKNEKNYVNNVKALFVPSVMVHQDVTEKLRMLLMYEELMNHPGQGGGYGLRWKSHLRHPYVITLSRFVAERRPA